MSFEKERMGAAIPEAETGEHDPKTVEQIYFASREIGELCEKIIVKPTQEQVAGNEEIIRRLEEEIAKMKSANERFKAAA